MLSRRDRAACVLALECLRLVTSREWDDTYNAISEAFDVLAKGGPFCATFYPEVHYAKRRTEPRRLRARICLYLRALLRADRGDFGPLRCRSCRAPSPSYICSRRYFGDERPHTVRRQRITPIWYLAPSVRL